MLRARSHLSAAVIPLSGKRMSARGMPWLAAMDAMRHDRGNTNFKSRKNAAGKIILWDWEAL
jgi:hypothetical protein